MRFVLCFAVAGALASLAVNVFIEVLADTPAEHAALAALAGTAAALGAWPLVPRLRVAASDDYLWDHVMGWSTATVIVAHVAFFVPAGVNVAVAEFRWPVDAGVLSQLEGVVMGAAGAVSFGVITLVVAGWITVPFGVVAGLIAAAWQRRAAAGDEQDVAPFSGPVHPEEEVLP